MPCNIVALIIYLTAGQLEVKTLGRKKSSDSLTREMILEEADHQLLQMDFQKVSMRSIANGLGVSHGSIYYHFQSKEQLFNGVIEKYFAILNRKLDAASQDNGNEGTKRLFLSFIEFGLNNQSHYDFMFVKQNGLEDPLQQHAAKESLNKFISTVQMQQNNSLSNNVIHASFIALHGFILYYIDRVDEFEAVKIDANEFVTFQLKTLDN